VQDYKPENLFLKKWKIWEGHFNFFTKRGGYRRDIPFFLQKVWEVVESWGEFIFEKVEGPF
jgi:hypothetical protein